MKVYAFYIISNVFNDSNSKKKLSVMLELLQSKIQNCQIKMDGYSSNFL